MATVNLQTLGTYTNELSPEIFKESVLQGKFISQIAQQPGIKTAEYVTGMRSTLQFQSPTCGSLPTFATDAVTVFRNLLTVTPVEVSEGLCPTDFDNTYLQVYSKLGSYNEDVTEKFASVYMADKINKTQKAIGESAICASPTGTFSSTYTLGYGILHTLTLTSASASIINAGITQSYNLTTAYNIVRDMALKLPAVLTTEPDVRLRMNTADYRTFVQSALQTNNYHIPASENLDGAFEMYFPGTNVKVTATPEMNAINNAAYSHWFIMTTDDNLVYGYDKINDSTNNLYSWDNTLRIAKYLAEWKFGISFKYAEYIVLGKCN